MKLKPPNLEKLRFLNRGIQRGRRKVPGRMWPSDRGRPQDDGQQDQDQGLDPVREHPRGHNTCTPTSPGATRRREIPFLSSAGLILRSI